MQNAVSSRRLSAMRYTDNSLVVSREEYHSLHLLHARVVALMQKPSPMQESLVRDSLASLRALSGEKQEEGAA